MIADDAPGGEDPGALDDGAPGIQRARWGLDSAAAGWRAQSSPGSGRGWWRPRPPALEPREADTPAGDRLILDLCGGSGAWSAPYREAGYRVEVVTMPALDVRVYRPMAQAWGVLAAPPCERFSRATRRAHTDLDHAVGMEVVNACLRVIFQVRPRWWALENPWHGDLSMFLGPPSWTFHPWQFGDAWTKPTGLWGVFTPPAARGEVEPHGSAMDRGTPAARAVTPPGFARAFFSANP